MTKRFGTVVAALLALVGLNLLLGLENLWPTPWPRATLSVALESLALLLLLVLIIEVRGRLARGLAWLLSALLLLLVLCRYGQVTLAGLFGRPPDLYWDLQHLPGLGRMVSGLLPAWQMLLAALVIVATLILLFALLLGLLKLLATGLTEPLLRRGLAAMALVFLTLGFLPQSPLPIAMTAVAPEVGRQAMQAWRYATMPSPVPPLAGQALMPLPTANDDSPDVFVIFWESYGATVLDNPNQAAQLSAARTHLEKTLGKEGWSVASALVRSPTFGGGSWFAHASLLTGRMITGEAAYRAFLAARPESLLDRFGKAGYRRVALMPGLKFPWPEGADLGFDQIYDDPALAYAGPAFGWWRIPDQFTLERLYQSEISSADRAPLFVLFPSIMSHIPFAPTPPYLESWDRLLRPAPFSDDELDAALAQKPSWRNLEPSYLRALSYNFEWFGGFLSQRAPENALILVLGDHQPPAAVTGPDARWAVPVHVISRNPKLLTPFIAQGFATGLTPPPHEQGPMAGLSALLLEALSESP